MIDNTYISKIHKYPYKHTTYNAKILINSSIEDKFHIYLLCRFSFLILRNPPRQAFSTLVFFLSFLTDDLVHNPGHNLLSSFFSPSSFLLLLPQLLPRDILLYLLLINISSFPACWWRQISRSLSIEMFFSSLSYIYLI